MIAPSVYRGFEYASGVHWSALETVILSACRSFFDALRILVAECNPSSVLRNMQVRGLIDWCRQRAVGRNIAVIGSTVRREDLLIFQARSGLNIARSPSVHPHRHHYSMIQCSQSGL